MLAQYNLSRMPAEGESNCVAAMFGRKMTDVDGNTIAGCLGVRTVWGTAEVSDLWVEERYRSQGLGSQLLLEIELEAKKKGCTIIQLDTFDWQAKDFYEKKGYSVFGILEDCPMGHCRYYMKKAL
ncbi:MAG: GNAT family N-acetyltransferase [Oscillospiraceae bacterium]|nr:GNAT family N-acetyltransferase [Oscillospiraceae bacterium]